MKRITSSIFLATLILSNVGIFPIPPQVIAQTQENGDLFYLYKGQRIPLNQRQDAIAVSFKQLGRTRSLSAPPLYLQLQQDLQSGIRSTTPPQVTPLGENYALVNLPKDIQNALETATKQVANIQKNGDWLQTTEPENTDVKNISQSSSISAKTSLLGLAWHLDSRPLKQGKQDFLDAVSE